MSWINGRQHGPPMPPPPTSAAAQSGSVGFVGGGGGVVQQQDWQQQQLQPLPNYGQQPQQYPQQTQVPNNFYNSAPTNQALPQQSWQQPPLQQQYQQSQFSNTQFYNKQQPLADNYVQPLLLPPLQPQQYQQQPLAPPQLQQQQLYQQQLVSSNVPNPISQQFMKPEQPIGMSSTATPVQHLNENPTTTEGWGDWDWNDNNQSLQAQQQQQQQLEHQNTQNLMPQNVIADSFSTEKMDNWKWNSDESNSNVIQSSDIVQNQLISNEQQHAVDQYGPSSLGVMSTSSMEDQSIKQVRPPSVGLAAPPAPVSTPFSQAPPVQQQPNAQLDSTGNAVSNNVYVSQAKPVAQPARQYAMTPLVTSQSPSPNAISDLPPPSETPPQTNAGPSSLPSMPPPPPITQAATAAPPPPLSANASNNPYKRAGVVQHHRTAMAPAKISQPSVMPNQFYGQVSGDFQQTQQSSGNQEFLAPDNSEVITDKNFEVENLEVAPSNDRNQYLQTGHLSEEGYNNVELAQEQSELDNFPPPGLSRFVLGQPEIDNTQSISISQPDIPPGLDRMIPGTELVSPGLNLERQADGQDTIPAPRSAFTNVSPVQENDPTSNIDITTDRNLYLVPGESDVHEQRIVTGLENGSNQEGEQREVELDGENLEDQQQQQHQQQQHLHQQHYQVDFDITRDEPIEGANTLDPVPSPSVNHETESSLTVETYQKDVSNPSTCNDDSDHKVRHSQYYGKTNNSRRQQDDKKRRPGGNDTKDRKERYDTEESEDYSSDHDRRRYREGSVRNDRDKDRESKERNRREKREGSVRDRDNRYRDEKDRDGRRYDRERHRDKYDRDRARYNTSRYETDSKYETESSSRHERRRGGDRDRNNDHDYRRDEKDKRYKRGSGGADRHSDRDDRDHRRRDNDRDYRDRRRDPRDNGRNGPTANDYDDDYRRMAGSRNARESERDIKDRSSRDTKDPRYQQNMYGYQAGYGYDAYSYYQQHQQYYEQLRRTNPQAYAEWYRKYYGQIQNDMLAANDGRESVHSGRSSANNDKDRSDPINSSLIDGAGKIQDPARSTPCKFITDHSTVSLGSGLVVCVKPKYSQNGITNIVKVLKFAPNDSTRRLFHSFPGPLVRGITHKKTIIEFCENQIRLGPPSSILRSRNNSMSSICSMGPANKASFNLMWTLLILLLRQNGMVVGTDIAELLMKNENQFPYESNSSNAVKSSSNSRRNSNQSDQKKSRDNRAGSSDVDDENDSIEDKDETSEESDSKRTLSELEITEKFRNHLLYGNVNEALEWATENNLWGHALFLASKVDSRSHTKVMIKFANKLSLNDPLQTLYQLMSGRTPSSVTSIQNEKWGDWRPHLAMILSNTSQWPDLDRKAITTLGDSLYNRGDLYGAQFCYLMAQVGFGRYSSVNQESSFMSNSVNAVRLVLLGSSHHKMFRDFATNEAIMMTEIYEYACALNDDKFSLVEFQPYKYLLGLRMLDYGLQLKTLLYMEQISKHIQLDPSKYEISLIEKVYSLSDRLKFFDPVLEKSIDDQQQNNEVNQLEDQEWLQSLRAILNESNMGAYQNIPQQMNEPPSQSQINQQFAEINKQFNELNLQYNNFEPVVQEQQQSYSGTAQFQPQYEQTPISAVDTNIQSTEQYGQLYNPNQQMNSLPDYSSYGQQNYDQQQNYEQEQSQSLPVDNSVGSQGYAHWNQQQPTLQQQQQPNETQTRPTISMPNSVSNKSGFYDDAAINSTSRATANKSNGNASSDRKGPEKVDNKKQNSGGNATANSGWFGGIWNKLSLKPKNQMILPDDKNPAIVWDSNKNKWVNTDGDESVQESFKPPPKMADVVQSVYNQQVTSGGVPSLTSFGQQPLQQQIQTQLSYNQSDVPMMSSNVPQPTTSPGPIPSANTTNSMSASANASAATAAGGGEQMKTPSLQSNMFKLQRNRTLKKSYVDVFNPSGAPPSKPVENVLAPILPPAAIPQSGFFIPAPIASDDAAQQQDGMPQFYNPNQFSGYQQ